MLRWPDHGYYGGENSCQKLSVMLYTEHYDVMVSKWRSFLIVAYLVSCLEARLLVTYLLKLFFYVSVMISSHQANIGYSFSILRWSPIIRFRFADRLLNHCNIL